MSLKGSSFREDRQGHKDVIPGPIRVKTKGRGPRRPGQHMSYISTKRLDLPRTTQMTGNRADHGVHIGVERSSSKWSVNLLSYSI